MTLSRDFGWITGHLGPLVLIAFATEACDFCLPTAQEVGGTGLCAQPHLAKVQTGLRKAKPLAHRTPAVKGRCYGTSGGGFSLDLHPGPQPPGQGGQGGCLCQIGWRSCPRSHSKGGMMQSRDM